MNLAASETAVRPTTRQVGTRGDRRRRSCANSSTLYHITLYLLLVFTATSRPVAEEFLADHILGHGHVLDTQNKLISDAI
jgi:hypothetical protein